MDMAGCCVCAVAVNRESETCKELHYVGVIGHVGKCYLKMLYFHYTTVTCI